MKRNAAAFYVANFQPIIQGDYSVRALNKDDVEILKYIRTLAVSEYPNMFLDNAENTHKKSNEEWLSLICGENKCIFGLFEGVRVIGLASVFQPNIEIMEGHIAMGYIVSEYRGKGLSSLLYQARIKWAVEHSHFKALTASHREGNEASRKSMMKHGFIYVGQEPETFGDGTTGMSYKYKLDLEPLRL